MAVLARLARDLVKLLGTRHSKKILWYVCINVCTTRRREFQSNYHFMSYLWVDEGEIPLGPSCL